MEKTGAGADLGWLQLLQRQHLLNVPFENLDIHWKRPILLDTGAFYRKIVEEKRGGFCYELNGLFNELLREIGFETRLLSARVGRGDGTFSPEYDHAAIIVIIGELEYLADVGFGVFAAEPLRFVPDIEQQDREGVFVVRRIEDGYFEVARRDGDEWKSEYAFRPVGHDLAEFTEMCAYQQYSPDSHFLKNKICSLLTTEGRKTLTGTKFIITANGQKVETEVRSNDEFNDLLRSEFGIETPTQSFKTV